MEEELLLSYGINPALFKILPPERVPSPPTLKKPLEPFKSVGSPQLPESPILPESPRLTESPKSLKSPKSPKSLKLSEYPKITKIKLPKLRKLSKPAESQAPLVKKRAHCYNLRLKSKAYKKRKLIKDSRKCELLPVIPHQYHPYKSVDAEDLIRATKFTKAGQLECFEDDTGEYIILSWLTTARIFRLASSENQYREITRIPDRYIDISSNIITCLHYSDGKIYIAYLWGKTDRRPYVESRGITGQLLDDPLYFDEGKAIDLIHSDKDYIYIKTTSGLFDIHKKESFGIIHYCIDFVYDIGHYVQSTLIANPTFQSYTKIPLISATRDQVLVTLYDALDHKIIHSYHFADGYNSVAMMKVDQLYTIHRRMREHSVIDFGYLGKAFKSAQGPVFIHESRISFADTTNIKQVKVTKKYLYVFGSVKLLNGFKNYEIGCIYFPSLTPQWVATLSEVDDNSLIVPHSSGICLINGCQRISHIPTPHIDNKHYCETCGFSLLSDKDLRDHKEDHRSILSNVIIKTNKFLHDNGTSIFKKFNLQT